MFYRANSSWTEYCSWPVLIETELSNLLEFMNNVNWFIVLYVTRYEKIDRCDNKLKRSKRVVSQPTVIFSKNFFFDFIKLLPLNYQNIKFQAILATLSCVNSAFSYGVDPYFGCHSVRGVGF